MAINKNHEFEELDGVKCGIVEKNAGPERAAFLRDLLEFNGYDVKVVPAAPAKKPATAASAETAAEAPAETSAPPELFTVGVTDYTFNPINAIFGRLLRSKEGRVVTLAYWNQQEDVSRDDIPYYETKRS